MPKQQTAELKPFFHNKTVLVTGGTGSIGSQIVKRLLLLTPKQVIVFSKDDSKQYVRAKSMRRISGYYLYLEMYAITEG